MKTRNAPRAFKRGIPKLTHRERLAVPAGALVAALIPGNLIWPTQPDPPKPFKPGHHDACAHDEARAQHLVDILRASGKYVVDAAPVFVVLADAVDVWREREEDAAFALTTQEEAAQAQKVADRLAQRLPAVAPVTPHPW